MDREQNVRASADAKSDVMIWDTQYCPTSKAFSVFREAICSTFMPWSPEIETGQQFEGRVESVAFESGAIGRVQMTPIVAIRNKLNLAKSPISCYYANYVMSGELAVEQAGRTCVAKRGDLAVYDSTLPVTLTTRSESRFENLAFIIPKNRLENIPDAERILTNMVVPGEKMIKPLSSSMFFLWQNLLALTRDEQRALFDAAVSLLPIAARSFAEEDLIHIGSAQSNYLMKEILEHTNRSLANPHLSPHDAAEHVSVSVRYVHKLFASCGTTFGAYVMARRLEQVRRDLMSSECHRQPIFVVAYRWGFNDLSTFIRAFKKRYGCLPSRFRQLG